MTKISSREMVMWAVVLGASGVFAWSMSKDHNHDHLLGEPAPAAAMRNEQGSVTDLAELQGDILLLNLYANWCPPCRKEIPDLAAFHKNHGDKVKVFGVVFESGAPQEAIATSRKLGVTYPILLGTGPIAQRYELHSYPTTLVIDAAGKVVAHHEGVVTTRDLVALAREAGADLP